MPLPSGCEGGGAFGGEGGFFCGAGEFEAEGLSFVGACAGGFEEGFAGIGEVEFSLGGECSGGVAATGFGEGDGGVFEGEGAVDVGDVIVVLANFCTLMKKTLNYFRPKLFF